jgi:hypothetical protein
MTMITYPKKEIIHDHDASKQARWQICNTDTARGNPCEHNKILHVSDPIDAEEEKGGRKGNRGLKPPHLES